MSATKTRAWAAGRAILLLITIILMIHIQVMNMIMIIIITIIKTIMIIAATIEHPHMFFDTTRAWAAGRES